MSVVLGETRFGLSPAVLSALDEAFGFCGDLLDQPHCEIVEPGERHWGIFRQLCITTPRTEMGRAVAAALRRMKRFTIAATPAFTALPEA